MKSGILTLHSTTRTNTYISHYSSLINRIHLRGSVCIVTGVISDLPRSQLSCTAAKRPLMEWVSEGMWEWRLSGGFSRVRSGRLGAVGEAYVRSQRFCRGGVGQKKLLVLSAKGAMRSERRDRANFPRVAPIFAVRTRIEAVGCLANRRCTMTKQG